MSTRKLTIIVGGASLLWWSVNLARYIESTPPAATPLTVSLDGGTLQRPGAKLWSFRNVEAEKFYIVEMDHGVRIVFDNTEGYFEQFADGGSRFIITGKHCVPIDGGVECTNP